MLTNGPGSDVITGPVTVDNFAGPPLLVFADGIEVLGVNDPRWQALLTFVDNVGALSEQEPPLIAVDPLAAGYETDLEDVVTALKALAYLSNFSVPAPANTGPFEGLLWSPDEDEMLIQQWPICGPILAMPAPSVDDTNASAIVLWTEAWTQSALFSRIASNNLYGVGLMACGAAIPEERLSPPVYQFFGTGFTKGLNSLVNVWRRGGPTSLLAYQILSEKEAVASRRGISRRTHPALVPYIFLDVPDT